MSKNIEKDILNLFEELEKQCDKDMKSLLKAYKKQLNLVRNEIYAIWGKYTVNGELLISNSLRLSIMRDMEKRLVKMATELGNIDKNITTEILSTMVSDSYYKTAFAIDKVCDFSTSFSLLTKELIESMVFREYKGEMFSDRIWKNKKLLINRLKDVINNGIIQGKNSDIIAKTITKEFGVSAYESKRLIRTEMARVTAEAQDQIYKNSNVVNKVMWVSTLDNKTSEICQELDGKLFDKDDDSKPSCPAHPFCRSRYVGIVDDYVPTTRADNETKERIKYKTYDEWYKDKINK